MLAVDWDKPQIENKRISGKLGLWTLKYGVWTWALGIWESWIQKLTSSFYSFDSLGIRAGDRLGIDL